MPTMVSACDFHVPEIRSSRVTRRWTTLVRVTNRVTGGLLHGDGAGRRPGWFRSRETIGGSCVSFLGGAKGYGG